MKKEFLQKKTLNPEILNKPIRTQESIKNEINFLEVENNHKQKKSIFHCCSKILSLCKKKKSISLLQSY